MPSFYDPTQVGTNYTPDTAAIIAEATAAGLSPARDDKLRTMLLVIDAQIDFVHEDGALSVPGAVDDMRRVCDWVYTNAGQITTIAASLDSHYPSQIFYPSWWVNPEGEHPDPYTIISAEDVSEGRWQPTIEHEWSRQYVQTLEANSQKALTIWPYHTMIGTTGHKLTPAIYEAITYHAAARTTQPVYIHKGMIAKTEHYSAFEPEIKVPEAPNGTLMMDVIELVRSHDRVYIAGEAKSHCVLESTRSLVRYFAEHDPSVIERLYYITDGASAVAHPEVDFDAYAEEEFATFYEQGLNATTTDTPLS